MWLLMSAMVLSLYPTPSTSSNVHWSKVQWGKCADKATSRWEFQKQATGMRVVEKSTGRCLAIKAGELPVPPGGANAYGAMVAEPCGDGGPEKGASQLWQFRDQKATPMLITNDVKKVTGPLALQAGNNGFSVEPNWCMCDVFTPDNVGGTVINVAAYCGASNSQYKMTADGADSAYTVALVDPQHSALGQCLTAAPCNSASDPPCSLPGAWGWEFIGVTLVAGVFYVGGGVALGVKQAPGTAPSPKVHPHYNLMLGVVGLVKDGVALCRSHVMSRVRGAQYQAVKSAATAAVTV